MSYSITVNFSPATTDPIKCLVAEAENPTEIEASSTAELKFYADGNFYVLYPTSKASSAIQVTGATITSWTCDSPYKEGTLIISNPTDNVVITVVGKVSSTPLSYAKSFEITSKVPIDTRLLLTKEQMLNIKDLRQPDIYFCICKDDQKLYVYDKAIVVDKTKTEQENWIGKFRPFEEILDLATAITKALADQSKKTELLEAMTSMFNDEHFDIIDDKIDLAISQIQAIDGNE